MIEVGVYFVKEFECGFPLLEVLEWYMEYILLNEDECSSDWLVLDEALGEVVHELEVLPGHIMEVLDLEADVIPNVRQALHWLPQFIHVDLIELVVYLLVGEHKYLNVVLNILEKCLINKDFVLEAFNLANKIENSHIKYIHLEFWVRSSLWNECGHSLVDNLLDKVRYFCVALPAYSHFEPNSQNAAVEKALYASYYLIPRYELQSIIITLHSHVQLI